MLKKIKKEQKPNRHKWQGILNKSQMSIEFIFAVGIVFFIFLIIFGFMLNRNKELSESTIKLEKDNTCLLISSLMTSAFINGNGITINLSTDYNSNISFVDSWSNYKELNVEGNICFLSVHAVPNEKLRKGVVTIYNRNGYVDIKNV